MVDVMQAQHLLQKKKYFLSEFEAATQEMLLCPTVNLERFVQRRQECIEEIKCLDERLKFLCGESDEGENIWCVLMGNADIERSSDEIQPLVSEVLAIRTILCRIRESDLQAHERLVIEQEKILDQIKATNNGIGAKAARFSSMAGNDSGVSRLGKA